MSDVDAILDARSRLTHEARLREAAVPAAIADPVYANAVYQISRDAFRLALPMGLTFYYHRGEGVAFARDAQVSDAEVTLFLEGSVYGAIAWLNGFVPLHASAVLHDGRVHAFTGVAGEGKSTLVAGLARHGFEIFADDVVVLDVSNPEAVMALPGHKRLKLWADALPLTGQVSDEAVRPGFDKFYVGVAGFGGGKPRPLGRLYLLGGTADDSVEIAPITGSDRFAALRAAYYRPRFASAVIAPRQYFATSLHLAGQLDLRRFNRPRDKVLFADGVAAIAADIRNSRG